MILCVQWLTGTGIISEGRRIIIITSMQMHGSLLGILDKMNEASVNASVKEKKLIEVMNMRYSKDTLDKERRI